MAKTVQVSDDNGSNWYTLPGNSGSFNNESTPITDTIFGQTWSSEEIGLISWQCEAQAYFKGFAGYQATVKKAGTATAMTGEAMTLVSGKTYQVTDAAKRLLDRNDTFVVYDNGVDHTADVASYNYLMGEVTFDSSYTVTGPVTIDGDYLPLSDLGTGNAFTLTQSADAVETSDFATVQGNGGFRTFQPGLRTAQIELSAFYTIAADLRADLQARDEVIIEINPDGNSKSLARGFFKVVNEGQSGDVGALEEESITFSLNVPSSDYVPFDWHHESDTTLHQSIQICLDAFLNETEIDVQYLYDGTNGVKGDCIVTDTSLSSGLDAMNEFSVSFQGTGATTDVGTG